MTDPTQQPNMGTSPMNTPATPAAGAPTPPPTSPVQAETPVVAPSAPAATQPTNLDPFNLAEKTGAKPAMPTTPPQPAAMPETMDNIPEVKLPNAMPTEVKPSSPAADPMAESSQQA